MKASTKTQTMRFLSTTNSLDLKASLKEDGPAIRVEPDNIRFESVEPGVLYVMTFSIRNISKFAQRIRIQAPKAGYFALNYIPSGPVAPGLDIRAEVECQIPKDTKEMVFTDKITVSMGKHQLQVPLFACKPYANIKFDKTIDFGRVIQGQAMSKEVVFENIGDIAGSIRFTVPASAGMQINPSKLDLSAAGSSKSTAVVTISIDAKDPGYIRELIKVAVAGALEDQLIDVSVNVIEQKLVLLTENNRGTLEVADFGNLFFGQSKTINALLVNTGPYPLNFAVTYDEGEEDPGVASQQQAPQTEDPANSYPKTMSISPMDGLVKAFSQIAVSITFNPILNVPGRGFLKQYAVENKEAKQVSRRATIDCPEMDQKINIIMQGSAISPSITVTPSMLRFGDCPVNDRRDILVSLVNNNKFSTKFEFPRMATFKFEPIKGVLRSKETRNIIASFLPPQLGKFKTVINLSIADGLVLKELKALGEANDVGEKKQLVGGTDKLPTDFQRFHKFVNPEEEAEARLEKREAAALKAAAPVLNKGATKEYKTLEDIQSAINMTSNPTHQLDNMSSTSSRDRDHIYGLNDESYVMPLDENHPHIRRKANNAVYDTYLQQSHTQRLEMKRTLARKRLVARGAIDPTDVFNVDLGMERGLEEPMLHVPAANESLWLANGAKEGDGGAGGNSRLPVDENRLIQKKYSSSPATQAELRDCSVELTQDDLKLIQSSHKTIEFGKVNVGSLSAKNFVVSNDFTHALKITVEDLDPELQHSKALCQIVPQGCIAGFDIYFSSKNLGKYRKPFTWKINGIHTNKVYVAAEVVPIELVMNKHELCMQFPPESLSATLTQEIMLTNPGNAPADFLWGSAGAFECNPEKGSIPGGKSSIISITWSPLSGKRSEEELGLHITSGIDQTLKVQGILQATKAEFLEKRLMFGAMAVGTEKKLHARIKNVGENPLAFFVNPLDDRLGISLTPEKEYIAPGDTVSLTLSVTPKFAMNYDNTVISAKIRGGKQISVKIAGSSVVPQLALAQDKFAFGSVAVGSECRLPITLTNSTGITATMILDLNSFPDFKPCLHGSMEEDVMHASQAIAHFQEDCSGNQIKLMDNRRHSGESAERGGGKDIALATPSRRSKKRPNNIWRITITPNATITADMVFRPTAPRQYSFKMQLYLQGIQEDKTFYRDVTAIGTASILQVSSNIVDFGDRVVSRDPLSRMSYFLETNFRNAGMKTGFTFEIRELPAVEKVFGASSSGSGANNTGASGEKGGRGGGGSSSGVQKDEDDDDPSNQLFFISPTRGDLAPGSSMPIRITFQPQGSGDYSKKLEVYIQGEGDPTRPYMTILCTGSGLFPRLTFDRQHVALPNVPLGIPSRACFTVFNNGYNSLDIAHRVSPNIPVPLDVSYPDGNNVGIMVEKIRVHVTARADAPVSWQGKVEFYDQDGERFFISVSGCADSCLLTNYPFVRAYQDMYGFIGLDDQPTKFLKKTDIAELRVQEAKRKEELRKQRSLERQRAVEAKMAEANGDATAAGGGAGGVVGGKGSKKGQGQGAGSVVSVGDGGSVRSEKKGNSTKQRRDSVNMLSLDAMSIESAANNLLLEGVDLDRNDDFSFDDLEVYFLLKMLNKNICRKPFDVANFPHCITESQGELIIDCLEQMSGRRVPIVKPVDGPECNNNNNKASSGAASSSAAGATAAAAKQMNSEKTIKVIAANRLVYKYQQILNFMISHGALLSHVSPISMLSIDDYLLAQEYELTKDKSLRFTPAMLSDRRRAWEGEWLEGCKYAWMEVLYQAVKVYVLARVNYRDYTRTPGVVVTTKEDSRVAVGASAAVAAGGGGGKGGKKKGPALPKMFASSNVFTTSEAVLLAWASYHLERAGNLPDEGASNSSFSENKLLSFNKRVVDLDVEFKELIGFFQLVHSHLPDFAKQGEPLCGYTALDKAKIEDNYAILQEVLRNLQMDLGVNFQELCFSSRSLMLMILHLYLQLPSLVPKTKIDFTGQLGNPISKKIDLKNPSSKPVTYNVTLWGNPNFEIETDKFTIPPESAVEFLVTLNAKFCDPVSAKLTFWGVREAGVAGSTLAFQLISNITGRKPIQRVTRNVNVYDLENFTVNLKNPFERDGNFQVRLNVLHAPISVEDSLRGGGGGARASGKAETAAAARRSAAPGGGGAGAADPQSGLKPIVVPFDPELLQHLAPAERRIAEEDIEMETIFRQPFWCSDEFVQLGARGTASILVQMLPFVMGKYVCQLIFVDKETGEFSYEIHGEVGLPKATERIESDSYFGQTSVLSLKLASKNSAFEKALGQLTEVRIKNANKKIRARSILQQLLSVPPSTTEEVGQTTFQIEFVPSFFAYKKQIPFVSEYMQARRDNASAAQSVAPSSKQKDGGVGGGGSANNAKVKKVLKTSIDKATSEEMNGVLPPVNTAVLTFQPEKAGQYYTSAVIYAKDNKLDVRVTDLMLNVKIIDTKITLEFNGPCREMITQEIPIVNDSPKDWNLVLMLTGKGFSGPKNLFVPSRGQALLEIVFKVSQPGNYEGILQMRNQDGSDSFQYALKGVSEEPLSSGNLLFQCVARVPKTCKVPLEYIPRPKKGGGSKSDNKNMEAAAAGGGNSPSTEQLPNHRLIVETDLPYINGPETALVQPTGGSYNFTVNSPIGGVLEGYISFTDPESGNLQWYTVSIEASAPLEEKVIEVEATVRKAVAVEITLDNPTNQILTFDVRIQGDGLLGESTYILQPSSSSSPQIVGAAADTALQGSSIYELIYSPLIAGKSQGRITFSNELVGEVWYKLNMTALPAAPIVLETIESMLGVSSSVLAPVENPLPEQVVFTVSVTNPDFFMVNMETISLGPYAQSTFEVHFRPASLTEMETSAIILSNDQFGEIQYEVSGLGLLPGMMPKVRIESALGEIGSQTIVFRNPFPHPLPLDIVLTHPTPAAPPKRVGGGGIHALRERSSARSAGAGVGGGLMNVANESGWKAFELLVKHASDVVVAAKAHFHIAVSFTPDKLSSYEAVVEVRSSVNGRNLLWCYPLMGIAEAGVPQTLPAMQVQCKTSLIKEVIVILEGISREDVKVLSDLPLKDFSLETFAEDAKYKSVVQRCIRAQPLAVDYVPEDDPAKLHSQYLPGRGPVDFRLKCRVIFEPLRVFTTQLNLIVMCKDRGKWRVHMHLDATDPEPDDIIKLIAPVGGSDKVAFRLSNRFLGYSHFQAFFSVKSSPHFSVSPGAGVLAPYGSEGTPFVVTFAPTAYGNIEVANLSIVTDEAQWNYEIRGSYPDRSIDNTLVKSKVSSIRD